MANAAQTPKLQIGKLSPEDAERLASTFRPIWDLDDAPFAQGSTLSAADIDALAGGAGIAPSVRSTEQQKPPAQQVAVEAKPVQPSNPGHVPAVDAPKVEIAVDLDPADLVSATPPPAKQVAPAVPQTQAASQAQTVRKPYTPPRPPPEPVNMRDAAGVTGDFVPVKKSNTGLIIGGVAVVAIIAAVIGVKMMGGDKTASANKASNSQTSPGHEETTHIPPPPEVAATQEQTQPAPTQTQAPPVATAAKTNDAPIIKEFPTSAPTHTQSATASNVTAPVHTASHTTSGGGGHASGGGTKPGGKPAIVRDNPF
jgi:hypothetical protein